MNPTDDDRDLAYSDVTTDLLQEVLMMVALTMHKLFPTKWANEVHRKLILINVKSPNTLLRHILDETLNTKLKANKFCTMNNTSIQVLARATPQFNIPFDNEDTEPWSVRKTLRCGNCKTVACNRKTCTRSFLILESFDRPCFNCSTVGCHFRHCPHPMDEARCERNKTRFLTSSNDRPSFNCSIVGCHFRKCPHPIEEARCKRNKTRFGNKTRSLMSSLDASKRAVMASMHRDS